ncbi:hypothetical protein DL546_007874 [Coniochaeta pulveracea]|uniref:Uncharacterized protein n=1 Tax=Coniochaeta pulveracea TaxID=177199 RepID=A0A420YJI4_9PEZI|nr:hypothetical protein DL546_007874 [Coniochaeta pulveracea]
MDPTTTLFTFMLETHFSVRSVHLYGSWDNFAAPYPMERDTRRHEGQWRGCHSFRETTLADGADGDARKDGDLTMGQTYYYYYELDGTNEVHDSTLPSTNDCPYLPGQTVNTLWVPIERSLRKRSASLSSMRDTDLRTMNPKDKYVNPRPPPSSTQTMAVRRLATAPSTISHKRSVRSLSPGSSWSFSPRKLFGRKASSSSLREVEEIIPPENSVHSSWEGIRASRFTSQMRTSRDISPESLRRFLTDDVSPVVQASHGERPALAIPEDIAEEVEDDDNFATSATLSPLESVTHFTVLSPPPSQPSHSRCTTPAFSAQELALNPVPRSKSSLTSVAVPPTCSPVHVASVTIQSPRMGTSFYEPDLTTPTSPQSTASNEIPSFYNSDDEDDDEEDEEAYPLPAVGLGLGANAGSSISTYSLPLTSDTGKKSAVQEQSAAKSACSPELLARGGAKVHGSIPFLTSPIPHSGLDELMYELGWMSDFIRGKSH